MNYSEYVCEIHPFVREQFCYARTSNGYELFGVVSLDELTSFLTENCHNYNVQKIHFVGPESYINKLCEDIKYEANCHYGYCNIEIEVN